MAKMYKNIDWFLITLGLAAVAIGISGAIHIMFDMKLFDVVSVFMIVVVTVIGWILIAIGAGAAEDEF
jgi:hypothetical protein